MKIITVLDEKHWSQGAIDLGCYLSKLSHSSLTGIFPGYPDEENIGIPLVGSEAASLLLSRDQKGAVENTISRFQQACLQQDVNTIIQRDSGAIGSDLKTESLFADVIIVDEAISFSDEDNKVPSRLVTTLLADAKCPVIIAPVTFDAIDEIIFAYDSTFSSLFAIRQFTYLFPQFHDRKVLVVEVTDEQATTKSDKLAEWLNDKYENVSFETLRGDPADRLFEIVLSKHKSLLVLGASDRGAVSSFFKPGPAESIMKFADVPVFIARR